MLLLRPDSMTLAGLPGRIGFPGYSLTLVAKATLRLVPGGTCTLLEESLPLTGDEPPLDPDGPGPSAPLTYASDLPIAKPMADVLVVGNAHAPGGKPTQQMTASVRVGSLSRRFVVTGDRFWKQGLLSSSLSTAAPFKSMPLSAARAFGGPGSKANPAGMGGAIVELADGFKARPAPNLELDGQVMDSPRAKPVPALLGPIPTDWPARASLMTGFKGDYLKTRWPALPADFDFSYFQAADPAQRVAGYLRGDEEIELVGMHPEHATITTRLPGFRVRTIVRDLSKPVGSRDREIEMKLDTLWLHGEELLATVVWRGVTPVQDEYFEELESAYAVFERLTGTPMRLSVLLDATMRERLEGEEEPEADAEASAAQADGAADGDDAGEDEEILAGMPEIPPPPPAPAEPPTLSPEEKARFAALLVEQGVDPSILDEEEADEPEPEPEGWTRAKVVEASGVAGLLAGADLDGLDLGGLDLQGVVFDGASLVGTRLSGARLGGAMFNGARLEGASLDEADLTGASLVEADLTGASLVGVRAGKATLEGATLDGANLEGCLLEGCKAKGASFERARLTRARLSKADLSEASLENANLDEAVLREATLEAASLQDASARGANFDRSVLTKLKAEGLVAPKASFVAAAMDGAWFENAKLASADFRYAQLADCGFARSELDDADLSFAVLRRGFFLKASLRRARLVKADLFEAIMEKADLREADLSGASAFTAEFLDAKLAGARLGGTDLGRTKAEGLAQ